MLQNSYAKCAISGKIYTYCIREGCQKNAVKSVFFLLALVHFMVLGSRAPWSPNTINICWAPEISWVPIASKLLLGRNGSPTNFGSPGRPNVGGV